ncbi:uncharacterized protein LOC128390302 [Panonychus citri]|uniref:uncharacterized protein LOC128390302 n=1 Tax=Panonychus citri TaxID=50023 RepID=UPI002307C176|nr:uncharacterized protein LOC128390302 [Panonychus citri]
MTSLFVMNLLTFLFLSNFCILRISTESIYDLPWTVDKGNWIITAKLISSNDGVFDIREYVHSSEVVRGKITISSGDDTMDIFYSSEFKNDRLVIQNQQCFGFNLKNKWDHKLFNIDSTKPLLNHLLMTGPSIVFRINGRNFIWRQDEDTNINGFAVHSANTTFNRNLDIIYYYKTHLDSPGILKANRLQFDGPFQIITSSEIVNLDIYSITKTQEELDKVVTVTPGIGCPLNLITSKSHDWFQIPEMVGSSYHFVSKTTVNGPKKSITLSEMYVNGRDLTTSLKTIEQGIVTESIYDYNLGTIYSLTKEGRCLISGIGPNSPGISIYGTFTQYGFLNYRDLNGYSYLGKTFIRSGYEAHVWERVDYYYKFEGKKYDKFVTSHYFVKSSEAKLFKDFILVRTTTSNYKDVSTNSYKLIETITKDYYGLEETESGRDYEAALTLHFGDCYPDSKDRKTLAIYFSCDKDDIEDVDCVKYAENRYDLFKLSVKNRLAQNHNISPARVANIDLVFEDRSIKALVTFLKIPNIEDSLQKETIKLSKSTVSSLYQVSADSVGDCFYKQARLNYDPEAILFCYQYIGPNICGRIKLKETIVKDKTGTTCDVFYPTKCYSQFEKEVHLDKLENVIRHNKLQVYLSGEAYISYSSTKVVEITNGLKQNRNSFVLVASEKKLIDTDVDVILVKDVSNLGDCYGTCAHDDVNLCETFVYCQYTDKSSCYTSNIIHANLSSRTTEDESCKIYSKNRLLDYIKISSREFKQSTSIAIDVPLDDCASMCSSSDECFSFQQCGGSCTLSGFYTDSISQESSDCNIYIPKVSQQFISTGRKIVSQVFHTEVNLNLDQCAALCHSWTNTGESCVSFNYCPKNGEISSCSLSKYSTNDKSVTFINSGDCKNYQYKNLKATKDKNHVYHKAMTGKINGGAAFVLIIFFISIGLLLGFIFPVLIYEKLKGTINRKLVSSSLTKEEVSSFKWKRQIDQTEA